jgi:type II secretory pathway pseudopilin PulG
LVEVTVVVAIIGVVISLAISMLSSTRREQTLRSLARTLVGTLNNARATSASGRYVTAPQSPPECIVNCSNAPSSGDGPNRAATPDPGNFNPPPRITRAGIIVDRTTFTVFADDDRDPLNGEETTLAYSLERELGAGYEIVDPQPGTRIIFLGNGLRDSSSPDRIRVRDSVTGTEYSIAVGLAGLSRIETSAR